MCLDLWIVSTGQTADEEQLKSCWLTEESDDVHIDVKKHHFLSFQGTVSTDKTLNADLNLLNKSL